MYCENCGAQLKDGAKFCPQCGTKVIDDGPAPSSATASEPSSYRPSAFASGNPSTQPVAETPQRTEKLYYPDPKRYATYMDFKTLIAMKRADDIADFPDE